MSPATRDYGHQNYPLERIERAIEGMKRHGNSKIGIAGASTTGTLALVAASYFPDITLTIAMTIEIAFVSFENKRFHDPDVCERYKISVKIRMDSFKQVEKFIIWCYIMS